MTRRLPVLVETDLGPLAGIVAEPERPLAALCILHGAGSRYGPSRLWSRLADDLAGLGVSSLRMDYPGRGDSVAARPGSPVGSVEAVARAAGWFAGRAPGLPLSLLGSCGGALYAVHVATRDLPVAGVGLVVPYLRAVPTRSVLVRGWRGARQRLRSIGRRDPEPGAPLDRRTAARLRGLSERVPVWALVGEHDYAVADLVRVGGRVEVEVAAGLAIHQQVAPEAQQVTMDRVGAWIRRSLGSVREA